MKEEEEIVLETGYKNKFLEASAFDLDLFFANYNFSRSSIEPLINVRLDNKRLDKLFEEPRNFVQDVDLVNEILDGDSHGYSHILGLLLAAFFLDCLALPRQFDVLRNVIIGVRILLKIEQFNRVFNRDTDELFVENDRSLIDINGTVLLGGLELHHGKSSIWCLEVNKVPVGCNELWLHALDGMDEHAIAFDFMKHLVDDEGSLGNSSWPEFV